MKLTRLFASLLIVFFLCIAGCNDTQSTSTEDSATTSNTSSSLEGTTVSDNSSSSTVSDINNSSDTSSESDPDSTPQTSTPDNSDPNEDESTAPTVYLTAEKDGDKVTVKMNVKNNPGIAAFIVTITYNEDKVEPSAINNGLTTVESNLKQPNATLHGFVTAVYGNLTGFSEDGELFNIVFNIENPDGDAEFTIDADEDDFVAPDFAYINFKKQNTSISLD